MAKILLVDDDKELSASVRDWLNKQAHAVEVVENGLEARDRLKFYQYDLVILDLTLPDIDGLSVLQYYREAGGQLPVLILSGRGEVPDRTTGLDGGADDYLVKPFNLNELSARVRALLRRTPVVTSAVIKSGNLELDPVKCKVKRGNEEITLLPREFALLEFFMRHPGQPFNAEALIARVWPSDSETSPETIKVHIARLRSKIDLSGKASVIQNVRGHGYRFDSSET